RNGRLQVDRVAPDDGRGGAAARDRHLPADRLGLTPTHWRIAGWRFAGRQRSAPLRPGSKGRRLGGGRPACRINRGGSESDGRQESRRLPHWQGILIAVKRLVCVSLLLTSIAASAWAQAAAVAASPPAPLTI